MKKVLLALALVGTLIACGGGSNEGCLAEFGTHAEVMAKFDSLEADTDEAQALERAMYERCTFEEMIADYTKEEERPASGELAFGIMLVKGLCANDPSIRDTKYCQSLN